MLNSIFFTSCFTNWCTSINLQSQFSFICISLLRIENEIKKCSYETEKEGLEFKKREQDAKEHYKKNAYVVENSVGIYEVQEDDEPVVGIW